MMFLTFLLSFPETCPHHIPLLACGFTLLADWNHCLQLIDFKSSAVDPLIQSRSFEAKLGPSACIWAVLPGNLPLKSCVSWFTPACAAGTSFFGFAGKAFKIFCSYSVVLCVALEKLEWTWVWDTSYGITAVRFLYSLWLHSRTSWSQWKDSNGTPSERINCA